MGPGIFSRGFRGERNREIDLSFEDIHPGDKDGYLVADAKPFARAPADELPSRGLK
jgi:hypothetical protein